MAFISNTYFKFSMTTELRDIEKSENSDNLVENLYRRNSYNQILLIVLLFSLLNFLGYYYAYRLLISGVNGEFAILMENFEGVTLYIACLVPGVLLLLTIIVISVIGLPRIIEGIIKLATCE